MHRTRIGGSNGTVSLSGAVASQQSRALAERLAHGVSGVQRVVSGLEIRPAP